MRLKLTSFIFIALAFACSKPTGVTTPQCTLTPTLTTNEVVEITDTEAKFSGKIVAPTCDATVTSQGFVYSKTTLPKTSDNVVEVNGSVIFSNLSTLEQNTQYYLRTFFVNPTGTFYGNEVIFNTAIGNSILTTTQITNILTTSATSGGNVTETGGGTITARGVCWSTTTNPTINDSKSDDGTGIGSFSSNLTELTPNTKYYVRAYVTNSVGSTYGNEIEFTTRDGVPTLSTINISNVLVTSATSGGNITDDGGAPITSRGVCWSTTINPTINDNKSDDGTGIGAFNSALTGLTPYTTYYLRAYAVNNIGAQYGNEISFTTFGSGEYVSLEGTGECTITLFNSFGVVVTDNDVPFLSINSANNYTDDLYIVNAGLHSGCPFDLSYLKYFNNTSKILLASVGDVSKLELPDNNNVLKYLQIQLNNNIGSFPERNFDFNVKNYPNLTFLWIASTYDINSITLSNLPKLVELKLIPNNLKNQKVNIPLDLTNNIGILQNNGKRLIEIIELLGTISTVNIDNLEISQAKIYAQEQENFEFNIFDNQGYGGGSLNLSYTSNLKKLKINNINALTSLFLGDQVLDCFQPDNINLLDDIINHNDIRYQNTYGDYYYYEVNVGGKQLLYNWYITKSNIKNVMSTNCY